MEGSTQRGSKEHTFTNTTDPGKELKSHIGEKDENLKTVLETKEVSLQKPNNENDTLMSEIKRLEKEKAILEKEKTILQNEKDDALSRLSKLAGQKLTDGNPTITDLGNPNRPEKIGERWAALYTDEWTDVYEDLIEQNKRKSNNNELPEKQLIKIVDWCYKRCLEIAKEQNNKIHETLWEVVQFIHFLGAKTKKLENIKQIQGNIDTEDTMMISAMKDFEKNAKFQLQCSTTLIDAVRKQCCEDYISSYPESLTSVKHFMMKCSEFKPIDPNKFNKYNRSGTTVEYVVWPALLLHKDGPVLAKGTVQTNYEDKTVPRKKFADDIFEPPKTCKPSSTPTVKDDITSNEISNPVQCTKNALKGDSHASDSELKQTNPKKQDQPNNLSQKADFKSINPVCQSEEKESNGDSRQQVSANTDQSGLRINDTDKSLPKSKGCINQSGLKKIMKPGSGLQTGDAENINQSCRYLEENGESNNNTINDQLEGNSEVRAKGSEEVNSEPSNSTIGDKGIGDEMKITNNNDNSSSIATQHQCKPVNQYENITIKECHHTQDRSDMKCGELIISVQKGVQSQKEGRDIDYSKPQNDKYEPEVFSLDRSKKSPTHSSEADTDDKFKPPDNKQTFNVNGGITDSPTDSNVESKVKFYSKGVNQLNGPPQRSGTIKRELDKMRQRSKLPKEKDLNKSKKESKILRKNSSN
ncbi:unnamed protein product [Mytilus coruscus]|uniref:Mitochondria-eating protein C-terminal domain-containing protein n=1 Tax=Mytilus coruscus TaxID=42192 RepID=A0A6J8C773_MYTCO|nr:unnamed protein product [Mytilus coruscus]